VAAIKVLKMETSEKQITKKVSIDCPVCLSGNSFNLERADRALACEDCSFILADVAELKAIDSWRCIFCGSQYFYVDSPFSLAFLGRSTVCYVCEAKYKGVKVNGSEEKYNEAVANVMQRSDVAVSLKERVEKYNQRAG
jgi:hypothetical protein